MLSQTNYVAALGPTPIANLAWLVDQAVRMKIAALALLRMGCSVHIETVGREIWVVFLEQKVNGSAETLAVMWCPNGIRVGTRFHIIGYFGSAFEDRFAVNLPTKAVLAKAQASLPSH